MRISSRINSVNNAGNSKNAGFAFLAVIAIIAVIALAGGGYYIVKKTHPANVATNVQATTTANVSGNGDMAVDGTPQATTSVASASATIAAQVAIGTQSNMSLKSFLSVNQDLQCNISYSTSTPKGTIATNGTVYVSGDKMRGDFTISGSAAPSTANEAHVIRDGDSIVAWTGANMGVKLSLSAVMSSGTAGLGLSANSSANVNPNQNISYKCSNWTVDASKFVAPTSLKLFDLTSMMANIKAQVKVK